MLRTLSLSAVLLSASLAFAGCQSSNASDAAPEAVTIGSITPLHELDGVYLAGQPKREDVALLAEHGVKTVVNVRELSEPIGYDERAAVEAAGMTYVHLPWKGAAALTDEVFGVYREQFANAERPLVVHCGSSNRVGALWAAYRALDEGLDFEAALAEGKAVGLRSEPYMEAARSYVERNAGE